MVSVILISCLFFISSHYYLLLHDERTAPIATCTMERGIRERRRGAVNESCVIGWNEGVYGVTDSGGAMA